MNVLFQIQDEVLAELKRKAEFTNIYGISARSGTSQEDIAKALGQSKGLFYHVGVFRGANKHPEIISPLVDFTLMVVCAELPKLNRSNLGLSRSCVDCALNAGAALHLYLPPSANRCLVLDEIAPVDDDLKLAINHEEVDLLSWYASFTFRVAMKSLANVAEPANG